jgi:hypothetical protein
MSLVEAIGGAVSEGPQMHRHAQGIRLDEKGVKDKGAYAKRLAAWMDVEMIQMIAILCRTKRAKTNARSIQENDLTVLREERFAKTLPSPVRIESPHAFKALPHGRDAESEQLFEIR